MLLGLVMIVKNESKIIKRCLDSIKKIIDFIVISDTGSTDQTIEIIDDYISTNLIPGKVYKDEWKNFGYNRSKSITNTQEWLKENNYDLQNTYLLTIDADMIFMVKPSFKKELLKEKDSWCIQQMNPSMTYYNKRLFRSSLKFKCIGVTHEYWGCDDKDIDGKLEDLYINDIGDGGAKSDKFERDIRLLTQGLVDEPKNERYFFYLAQSYSDFGDKEKAIEFYKKRIEAGGWQEEVFMAHLRIGDIYNNLKESEKAFYWWSLAYDFLPSRTETLFRIIHNYRLIGKNNMALLYLKTALKIDYPKNQVLFIEHPIYQYRLLEELSICAFYTPHKVQGFVSCDYLLVAKNIPEVIKQQCYMNLFFYLPKLCPYPITQFDIKIDKPYLSSSPSLFKTKKGYSGNIRCVNYSMDKNFKYHIRDEKNHVKTKNYWVNLDENGKVLKQYEIISKCLPKRTSHISGLEDLRLCKLGTENNYELVALTTSFEYGENEQPSICLCLFDKDESDKYFIKDVLPTNYKNDQIQKNWAPFSENNKLYAIYCYEPLTILELDKNNGNCNVVKELKNELKNELFDLSKIRGSSSPVKLSDGSWLILVHEVLQRDTRKYFHRFLLYTKDWELKEISLSFYFKELFVEFCLSISLNEKTSEITIFFSKEDNSSEMITVKLSEISWIPKDINNWLKNELK